jgi:hypothetical protein
MVVALVALVEAARVMPIQGWIAIGLFTVVWTVAAYRSGS